ncbi:MAG: dTDP-4-dehydrorhamnose reductase [Treponema sp.]|nr:dTDP-4-dehydrorhamnose reductase [Treponema sp.]
MIWLIGSKGMLGSEVASQLTAAKLAFVTSDADVDITKIEALEHFAVQATSQLHSDHKIDCIINCAAYTAVDKAEDDAELAAAVNAKGVANIARVARNNGAKLIHISTDYVFDGTGTRPYTENDAKAPLGVYGKTKSDGEDAIIKGMAKYYILRTAWLYGLHGHNFVYTMTKLTGSKDEIKVVSDQRGTPTNASTLASVIIELVKSDEKNFIPFGIYHVTDEGETNWHEFACEINRLAKKYKHIEAKHECNILPCTTEEYPTKAKRPAYSVLDKTKIQEALHIKLPKWQKSLENFMKDKNFEVQ